MPTDEHKRHGIGINSPIEYTSAEPEAMRQLEAVFDAMADGVFVYDAEGRLIKTNTAGRELLGGDKLYRFPSSSLQAGAERFRLRNAQRQPLIEDQWPVIRLLRGEEFKGTNALDVLLQTLDGQERFFSLTGSPICNSQEQIVGAVIVVRDVTEHRQTEEALRKSEEQYRTIVQTANEGIWLIDSTGQTVYINQVMTTMLGYTSEEWAERTILDCLFPEDETKMRARISNNLRGYHEQFEFRFRRKDGYVLDTLVSTSPVHDVTGAVVGMLGLFTDITVRKRTEQALKHSEELLQVTLRNAPIAIFQQDRDLRYTWMHNPPTFTLENIVGKTDADFVSAENAAYLTKMKQHVLATGEGVREEVHIRNAVEARWELLTIEPLRDQQGVIVGIIGTSINITARKRLEEERAKLAEQAHRALTALLSMAQVMVQRPDSAPDKNTYNTSPLKLQSAIQQIAELTRDVLGCERLSLHKIESGTERLHPLAVVGLSAEQEQTWWAEQEQTTLSLSDGSDPTLVARLRQQEVLILDLTQPPYNEQPNPYGIHSMLTAPIHLNGQFLGLLQLDYRGQAHTYTDEEIALAQAACRLIALVIEREQLLASNQQLTELIELAHDAVLVRDPESRILFWNEGAEHLYGWTKQEAIGKVTHNLLATRFPHTSEIIDVNLDKQGRWEGILIHTRRDGSEVVVESRQVLIRDEVKKTLSILEINRDITERERLAQERTQALATEQALREANRLMDEFIGIAGHELRTPLTTIKASVQLAKRQLNRLLKQDGLPAQVVTQLSSVQSHLDRTERQIAMQNRLVSDLLDVSRIHSGRLELYPDLCDLAALVREVVEDQQYLTPERKLALSISSQAEILVLADADRVRQVVSNYLSNALKYSEATKPVEIHLEVTGMQARVSVRDEGPGLPAKQQQYVWERFYRVPDIEVKTGSGVGLGLGLHISRMIIERQRGQVGVQSEPGHGSTFWFTLPVAETP
jgi:PAS domain S-box-containing protein